MKVFPLSEMGQGVGPAKANDHAKSEMGQGVGPAKANDHAKSEAPKS